MYIFQFYNLVTRNSISVYKIVDIAYQLNMPIQRNIKAEEKRAYISKVEQTFLYMNTNKRNKDFYLRDKWKQRSGSL